jgi:hypothetical protein
VMASGESVREWPEAHALDYALDPESPAFGGGHA